MKYLLHIMIPRTSAMLTSSDSVEIPTLSLYFLDILMSAPGPLSSLPQYDLSSPSGPHKRHLRTSVCGIMISPIGIVLCVLYPSNSGGSAWVYPSRRRLEILPLWWEMTLRFVYQGVLACTGIESEQQFNGIVMPVHWVVIIDRHLPWCWIKSQSVNLCSTPCVLQAVPQVLL